MMNNETARERLKLAVKMKEASDRHSQISQEFADQSIELHKEVEAHFRAKNTSADQTDDDDDRPVSVQVLDRRDPPSFERLAAAVAEQLARVETDQIRRRPMVADTGVAVIRTQIPVDKPRVWTRIANWWAERSSERRLPVGW